MRSSVALAAAASVASISSVAAQSRPTFTVSCLTRFSSQPRTRQLTYRSLSLSTAHRDQGSLCRAIHSRLGAALVCFQGYKGGKGGRGQSTTGDRRHRDAFAAARQSWTRTAKQQHVLMQDHTAGLLLRRQVVRRGAHRLPRHRRR